MSPDPDAIPEASVTDHLTFDARKGRVFLLGEPVWIMSPEFYLDFQTQLENLSGKAAKGILYRMSFAAGQRTARRMAGPLTEADDLRERLQQVVDYSSLTGYGTYELTVGDRARAETVWVQHECLIADIHPPAKEPVCHLYAGFIAGWLTVLFDRPVECTEAECRSKGDPRCVFRTALARATPI